MKRPVTFATSMVKAINRYKLNAMNSSIVASSTVQHVLDTYISHISHPSIFEYDTNEISQNHIYTNNYINFDEVHTIGFDLDYTLVTYTVELQSLIYDLAKNILIESYGFPTGSTYILL
jgi:hypothetical protein